MKKKHSIICMPLWLIIIPAVAAAAILLLWNNIIPSVCGFASISYWQALGLFFLGQALSAGFVIGLFALGAIFHAVTGFRDHRKFRSHWHNMTDEQRQEFMASRRFKFGMHCDIHNSEPDKDTDVYPE